MGKYATINPATGEVVQRFDTMSDADADRALTRAHEAYLDWRNIELKERAAVLGRVADLFRRTPPPSLS
jgi:acyl-CoA reductase-like NAD-dependent aldehyde dehydrogenase